MKKLLPILLFLSLLSSSFAAQAEKKVGERMTISVSVLSGTSPFTYQWKKDGVNIPNATASNYVVAVVSLTDAGRYTCEVSNSAGKVLSDEAIVTVVAVVPPGSARTSIN